MEANRRVKKRTQFCPQLIDKEPATGDSNLTRFLGNADLTDRLGRDLGVRLRRGQAGRTKNEPQGATSASA
jgi:hypothetical protein